MPCLLQVYKPRGPEVIWKDIIYTLFLKAIIFTVAAKLKVLACIRSDVGEQA